MPPYPNYRLLLPYAAPYFAYVGIASLFSGIPDEWNYGLRIVVVSLVIWWGWRWYGPLRGPKNSATSIGYGLIAGAFGTALWIVSLSPFVDAAAEPWTPSGFVLRLVAATLLVPLFEERFMRVFVFRVAYQWFIEQRQSTYALEEVMQNQSIDSVNPGDWNVFAVIVSTTAFALGHQMVEWPASIAYGLLMALLWIVRKDILSCVIAHGTTNLALGIYVYRTQNWGLW